jgi:ribosomal protein L11 methyltransferase
MKMIQVTIFTTSAGIEAVTASLMNMGIEQLAVEDPQDVVNFLEDRETYSWDFIEPEVMAIQKQEAKIQLYFDDTYENRELVQAIKLNMMGLKSKEMEGYWNFQVDLGRLYVEDLEVDSKDWENRWKEYVKPFHITQTLVVKPTWEEYSPEPFETIMEIDPQMAFGTGAHETTALAMRLLEKHDPKGKQVLDVGVGSGILAIGAAMLGAAKVEAMDIDPVAVATALENVVLNRVEKVVSVFQGDFREQLPNQGDFVVSNLTAELIIHLSKMLLDTRTSPFLWISSGILVEQKNAVLEVLSKTGYEILEVLEEGEWCAIAAKK